MAKNFVRLLIALTLAGCGFPDAKASQPALAQSEAMPSNLKSASLLDGDAEGGMPGKMEPPRGRAGEWLTIGNHVHTTFSADAKQTLAQAISKAVAARMDGFILTDHNTMKGVETDVFKNAPIILIKGMEFGAWREIGETVVGHAGIIGMDGTESLPTFASLEQMLGLAKRRNAFVIANHPYLNNNAWASRPELQPEVDAVEVWNGWWALVDPLMHNNDAKDLWESYVAKGRHLTAMGGADSHGQFYDTPARATNLVFSKDRSAEAVLEGIRAGHVTVEATAGSPKMVLEADPDRTGAWGTLSGDEIKVTEAGRVPMRARVKGGKGLVVEFYGKAGRLGAMKVDSNDAVLKLDAVGVPGVPDYVRTELKKHSGKWWSLTAMANPIYLK